ncbi:peroxiredoxin [Mycolicibacterium grossiae]|uniref:Alkyl hydroperoxide reductase E n=1 Tax=Mycolicibacterium grossiae TaxID=1552759 RepID=A0A1E8Q1R5_9MYCO|nr:peroxiredoxin [Mycolicibacterium grossiae]OFJ52548.1 peroxiredoxin [Mycolicibacterium grossiae]QEM47192.1 peroxiredoxin [Mycolicibacterium grossiae]
MLRPGTRAPDFTLKDQAGQPVTLSGFAGARNVLLVFFPSAFTPTCRGELSEIRDRPDVYANGAVQTLAISVAPPPVHRVWAAENDFTFPLLSDFWPHGAVAQAYDVLDAASGFPNRGTFVVDRSGVIVFAEMKQPGEQRDQSVWADALGALAPR